MQVARPGGWRSSMAPRRSSTARAPPSTLRCGNRPHPRGRVRLQGGACVPSPPASFEGACGTWSATVMEFTGARWCYPVAVSSMRGSGSAEWPTWVGAEVVLKLRVLRSQPRPRCVLGLPRRGSTSGTTAQRYADGIARPVSKPPPAALPTTPSTGQVALAVPLAEAPRAVDEEEPHPSGGGSRRRSGMRPGTQTA